MYYSIYKKDKTFKTDKKITFKKGYTFDKKITITLYEPSLIKYVLIKKLNNSLKGLINLYKFYEDDDDDTRREALLPKIEVLRSIFLREYVDFLEEIEIESYLDRFNKLERKVDGSKTKKSRSR